MVPVCHVRMGSTGVWAPVWTASGMGHWKTLIKIPGGTDFYYCIKDMTLPDTCMLSCYCSRYFIRYYVTCILVTLPGTCYTFCGGLLLLYMYTLHCISSIFCIPCRHHYCLCTTPHYGYLAYAHLHVHFYHVTTSVFISITSPPDDNMLGSAGIKIWHDYIFLLLIIYLLYGITSTTSCIIYM